MRIKKWSIIYLPRYLVEPNSNGNEKEKRPVLVIKVYNRNVIIIPITKTDQSEKLGKPESSHIKINQLSKRFKNSFLKISVIQTLSIDKIIKYGQLNSEFKITEEYKKIIDEELKNFLFVNNLK